MFRRGMKLCQDWPQEERTKFFYMKVWCRRSIAKWDAKSRGDKGKKSKMSKQQSNVYKE